jgi:hypothetical protein
MHRMAPVLWTELGIKRPAGWPAAFAAAGVGDHVKSLEI